MEGGREANGGVVFLVPVTQPERRSTNKRILCPGWLPCKLPGTLLPPSTVCPESRRGRSDGRSTQGL